MQILSCHICHNHTEIKDGFKYGITLRKDPLTSLYVCEKHASNLPWRIKKPAEFRDFLSQFGRKRGKKKIMSRMRKARV